MTANRRIVIALWVLLLAIGTFAGSAVALSSTTDDAAVAAAPGNGSETPTPAASMDTPTQSNSSDESTSNETESVQTASSSDIDVVVHNFSADRTTRYPADAPVTGGAGSKNTDTVVDDRVWVRNDTEYAPWNSEFSPIVRIDISFERAGGVCTGAMVDEYHVLTSAHCLYNNTDQEWAGSVTVTPGTERVGTETTTPYGAADAVLARTYAPFVDATDPNTQSKLNDMALLTIDRPLGERVGTLDFAYEGDTSVDPSVFDGSRVDIAGYPGTPPKASAPYPSLWLDHGQTTGDVCKTRLFGFFPDCRERALTYDVYTTDGQSGSPVIHNPPWVEGGDSLTSEALILAVHSYSSTTKDGDYVRGYGPRITPTRSEHIESWIATDDGATASDAFAYRAVGRPVLSFASVESVPSDRWYDWGRMSRHVEVINGTTLHYERDLVNVGTEPFSGTVTVEFWSPTLEEFTRELPIDSLAPDESVAVPIERHVASGVGPVSFYASLSSGAPFELTTETDRSILVRETGDGWYGRQYDGRLSGYNPHTSAPIGPGVATDWTASLDDPAFTGVAVRNETAYAASQDGTVYAIDTTSGSVAWKTHVGAAGTNVSTAAVAIGQGNVYVGVNNLETNATVYAINRSTREVVWSVNGHGYSVDGITPTTGRLVYVNANGVFAIDSRDGSVYRNTSLTPVRGDPAKTPNGPVVVSQGGNVTSYSDIPDEAWTIDLGTAVSGVTVGDEFLFARDGKDTLYGIDHNATDARTVWEFTADDSWVPGVKPVVADGRVIIGDGTGTVYARETGTGTGVWRTTLPTNGGVLRLAGANGTIYATTEDGDVFAVNATDGSVLWQETVSERHDLWATPVVVDGRVIIPTAEGEASRVVALETSRPTPAFEHTPADPVTDETVTFDAAPSTAQGSEISSYAWDFDDDGATDATGIEATHTFASTGQYPVTLTVTTDEGATNTMTRSVTIGGRPPEPRFDNWVPVVGEPTLFNASNSSDPDGYITAYEWDFDGDGVTDDTGVSPGYTFETVGEHAVRLTVTDNGSFTDSVERVVNVTEGPVPRFDHTEPVANHPITFDASESTDDGGVVTHAWDVDGDDEFERTGETVTHTYAAHGTRQVTLRVTDDRGVTNTTTRTISVERDTTLVDVAPDDLPGAGTGGDPYVVSNASELQAMADEPNAHYRLGADINASGTDEWNDGRGFDPIGDDPGVGSAFDGSFDGAGHTISGLAINRSEENYTGLFGYVSDGSFRRSTLSDARIENITLDNVTIVGSKYVGGLVGFSTAAVKDASVAGTVDGNGSVGGLVGFNRYDGTVARATATGPVAGTELVGGLVGDNRGTVLRSYVTAAVTGSGDYVGGLAGQNKGRLKQSYATGTVTGAEYVGGLVGYNTRIVDQSYAVGPVIGTDDYGVGGLIGENRDWSEATVHRSFWDTSATGQTISGAGTGLTTDQMTGEAAIGNMTGFDFDGTWASRPGDYPELVMEEAYEPPVLNDDGYQIARNDTLSVGEPGVLANDTDPDGDALSVTAIIDRPSNGSVRVGTDGSFEYVPDTGFVGEDAFTYVANADGGGTEVATVRISVKYPVAIVGPDDLAGEGTPESPYVVTNASELQAMEDDRDAHYVLGSDIDASATGTWHDGRGFDPVGSSSFSGGTPFDGSFDGAGHVITGLTIDRPEEDYVGLFGVVGLGGSIENVTLSGGSIAGADTTGSLAGYTNGNVTASGARATVTGGSGVGGLLGGTGYASQVAESFATGSATGSKDVGGLVGKNSGGTVVESYATGAVDGRYSIGGLVGRNEHYVQKGTVNESWAAGAVTGSSSVGGLVGSNDATVNASYWDVNATGQDASAGGTGLTTAGMTGNAAKANMAGFAFGSVWQTRMGYPILEMQPTDPVKSPQASFIVSPETPATGTTVIFDASGATDPDGSIRSYDWDLTGDGSVDKTGTTVSYTYTAGGDYDVTLTVTDNDGATNTTNTTVSVVESNVAPQPSVTISPESPTAGSSITFDASASMDPDGTITSYGWDLFGNGSIDATGSTASVAYSEAGEYTVSLVVSDDDGATAETTQTVTVNAHPEAQISVAPTDPEVGQEVTFTAPASTDPDGTIETYEWDLTGDGTVDATGPEVTRTYQSSGAFQITLTVIDDDELQAQDQIELTVQSSQTTTPGETETTAPEETETTAPGDTETTAPGGTESEETISPETSIDATQVTDGTGTPSQELPGFGIGTAITGLGGAGYILKRRLDTEDIER